MLEFTIQGVNVNLEEIDFNNLYKEQKQKTTFKMKGVEDWNKKAVHMNERIFKCHQL